MSITVIIPTVLRTLTAGQKRIDAQGTDIGQVFDNLETTYPGLKARLVAEGRVQRFVNVYVNDDDIRFAEDLATPVNDGDTVTILPAVAGGAAGCAP